MADEKPKWRNDKNEWITETLLNRYKQEAEDDPIRNFHLSEGQSCQRFYNAITEWWVTSKGIDNDVSTMFDSVPTAAENHAAKTINDLNSLLLKNDPEVRHHPQLGHPEDSDLTDDMDGMLRMTWRQANVKPALSTWVQQASIRGMASVKIVWNRNDQSRSKYGDIGIIYVPPEDLFYDTNATNSNRAQDCRYIIHRSKISPETIFGRYSFEGLEAAGYGDKSWWAKVVKGGKTTFDFVKGIFVGEKRKEAEDYRVEVLEYWLFPVTKFDNYMVGGEGVREKDYPFGVVATMVEGKIVDIMPNPFVKKEKNQKIEGTESEVIDVIRGHKRHPFVPLWWIRCATDDGYNPIYACRGAMTPMKAAQSSLYSLLSSSEIHCRVAANTKMLTKPNAFKTPMDRITGGPGEILVINDLWGDLPLDQVVKELNGSQMSPDLPMLINRKTGIIPILGGLNPGMTGAYPAGTSHTPGVTIAALQEASFTPMWAITKEIDDALKDVSELIMGNIQQFYEPGRFVDVSDDGMTTSVELSKRHLQTRFQRVVVQGTTTPFYDIDRETRMATIKVMVDQAIAQSIQLGDTIFMETCAIYLQSLRYPPAYQYIQLLHKKMQELGAQIKQQQMATIQAGEMGVKAMVQEEQPPPEDQGLRDFEGELGVPPGALDEALNNRASE